ncbi:hypothetical protein F5888DRAFT_1638816 [Russula emetica]|nr:hypothetical protein F5888DRAFT_1638816 [Russula emetica]
MLFPENTPYRVPNNPFRGPTSKGLSEIYKKALREALHTVRSPFLFNLVEPYSFDGTCVGVDTSSDSFNSAVTTVIAAIERGQETALEKVRAEAADPNPILSAYPTLFHRLGATAEEVAFNLGADAGESPDGYQEWYSTLKNRFARKATKAAATEVDEKWLDWKANQLDRLAATFQLEIGEKARERGTSYFIETAERLGLQVTRGGTPIDPIPGTAAGKKCTASGSTPKPVPVMPSTPSTPKATRVNPPRAVKRTPAISPAPRGRDPAPASQTEEAQKHVRGLEENTVHVKYIELVRAHCCKPCHHLSVPTDIKTIYNDATNSALEIDNDNITITPIFTQPSTPIYGPRPPPHLCLLSPLEPDQPSMTATKSGGGERAHAILAAAAVVPVEQGQFLRAPSQKWYALDAGTAQAEYTSLVGL